MTRFGPLNILVAGMTTIIVALSLFAIAAGHTSYFPGLLAGYTLLGLGGGMSFLPLLTISMSEVPMANAGVASGFSNELMQIGGALGLASVGTIATGRAQGLVSQGDSLQYELTSNSELAFGLPAASVGAGLTIVL